MIMWVAWMYTQDIKHTSMKVYMSGLQSWHEEEDYPSPMRGRARLWRVWKGVKRLQGGKSRRDRYPITTQLLSDIRPLLNLGKPKHRMLWAAYTLGTYGLLRVGEFTIRTASEADRILRWRHISWFDADGKCIVGRGAPALQLASEYRVLLEASKTDPFRMSVSIRVASPVAVAAMRAYYCTLLLAPPSPQHPVFSIKSTAMTREFLIEEIRKNIGVLGLDQSKFSGHSFRRGGAQSLADAGVAPDVIKTMGRWSSDCYQLYISTPSVDILAAALAM